MSRLKTYSGANLSKTYFNGGIARNETITFPILNPDDITSLQVWFDAVENTVTANGSDQILTISNEGALGGNFSFYPTTATFDPAEKANFVIGSGNTQFYRFRGQGDGYVSTLYKDVNTITPKTVISIARKVSAGTGTPFQLWNVTKAGDGDVFSPQTGIQHPPTRTSLEVAGRVDNRDATPSVDLGDYVYGESDFTFFAWSAEDYRDVNNPGNMQTKAENPASVTLSANPGAGSYYWFIANAAEDASPGAFSTGINEYAAIMVFDEVLTTEQIGGIYRYYTETRGYSVK